MVTDSSSIQAIVCVFFFCFSWMNEAKLRRSRRRTQDAPSNCQKKETQDGFQCRRWSLSNAISSQCAFPRVSGTPRSNVNPTSMSRSRPRWDSGLIELKPPKECGPDHLQNVVRNQISQTRSRCVLVSARPQLWNEELARRERNHSTTVKLMNEKSSDFLWTCAALHLQNRRVKRIYTSKSKNILISSYSHYQVPTASPTSSYTAWHVTTGTSKALWLWRCN